MVMFPLKMVIFPLKMVIFHSYDKTHQRVAFTDTLQCVFVFAVMAAVEILSSRHAASFSTDSAWGLRISVNVGPKQPEFSWQKAWV